MGPEESAGYRRSAVGEDVFLGPAYEIKLGAGRQEGKEASQLQLLRTSMASRPALIW